MLLHILLLLLPAFSLGKRREMLPIDREPGSSETSSRPKASECRFGGTTYELEQTWHPDLGPPFNVMYCVHCECVPIHKKRRIVGRVRCKNIKTECPKPTCPDPVLLPGRCCKVCPGQNNNPDLTITVDLEREEQERNGRHYAAVLTGEGISAVATARFYFRKKTLQYSFLFGEQLDWPSHLTFLDSTNDIIEEFSLYKTPLQNRTEKLCGSWERLPRKYRRTLRSEDMVVSLTTRLGSIAGKVSKYYGLTSEMFSGLLEGESGVGTAIVSVSPATGSVHANILFKGLTTPGQAPVSLQVKFQSLSGGQVEETVVLDTVPQDTSTLTSLEIRTVFDNPELTALGRGDLTLSLSLTSNPEMELTSTLVPRLSCDVFDCVLKSDPSLQGPSGQGMAFMYFNRAGGLAYNIRIDSTEEVTDISIDNGKKSRRLLTVIPGLASDWDGTWSNGTAYLAAGQVEELYKENLYLSVHLAGSSSPSLRGRLMTHLAGPAESSGQAVMLSGDSESLAVAWTSLDHNCRLHYTVRGEGPELEGAVSTLELEDHPVQNLKALPLFPSQKMELQNCQGLVCTGHADNIHKLTMARMDSGDATLLLSVQGSNNIVLKGDIVSLSPPSSCLPSYARNDLESIPGYLSDLAEQIGDDELAADMRQKCVYEGAVYEAGSQWEATHTSCEMCSCQRGRVVCEAVLCPPTNCSDPIIIEGECCASCGRHTDTGRSCNFGGESVFQPAGSRWHPYIPPFGFSRCAICTCKESTLTVECHKEECPPLTECLHSEAIRAHPLDCCKHCPQTPPPTSVPDIERQSVSVPDSRQGDQARTQSPSDILAAGGCAWKGDWHINGDTWHPIVVPWGEVKCVNCSCKDGVTTCKKRRCKTLKCPLQLRDADTCCPRCAKGNREEVEARQSLVQSREHQRRRQRRLQRQRQSRRQGRAEIL